MMQDTIFTKIIKGEIPCYKIAENDDFIAFLASELEKNVGLTKENARHDAEAMAEGKRLVREGQYAVLELEGEGVGADPNATASQIEQNPTSAYYYYKRVDDQWIKDDAIDGEAFIDESKLFCNVKQQCYDVDNVCSDNNIAIKAPSNEGPYRLFVKIKDGKKAATANFPFLVE